MNKDYVRVDQVQAPQNPEDFLVEQALNHSPEPSSPHSSKPSVSRRKISNQLLPTPINLPVQIFTSSAVSADFS